MNHIRGTVDQDGVEGSDWDPSDPSKKKVKKARRYSFEHPSNKQSAQKKSEK